MIRYDFINGIVRRAVWLFLPVSIFIVCVISLWSTVDFINYDGQATLGECLVFYLQGSIPSGSEIGASRPNLYWLLIHLGCLFFTLEYPVRDLNVFGQQIIVRGQSRIKWWLCKCLWMAESVVIYWLTGVAVTAVFAPLMGAEMTLLIKQASVMKILNFCNVGFGEYKSSTAFLLLFLLPVLSMLAVCLICMAVSLLLDQIFALISGIAILFIPSQFMTPVIVTNYTMLQRCSHFYRGGLDFYRGIIYTAATISLLVITGAFIMQNKDILEPKKNGEE